MKETIVRSLAPFKRNLDEKNECFSIQIGPHIINVPMRNLKPSLMEYYGQEMILPIKEASRMNDSIKFLPPKQITNGQQWAVTYCKRSSINYCTIHNFFGKVPSLAAKLNMSMAPKPAIIPFDNISQTLRELKDKKYDLVFVIIPRSGTTYAEIKQQAELKVGLLTQCVAENTIKRHNDFQTVTNILLKVNRKLNGRNHRVNLDTNIPEEDCMFLGADVMILSADVMFMSANVNIPSVVGVAASHDANGSCYNMQYRLQKSTFAIIVDMDAIFSHHLRVYFQKQGKYPSHIIYFRDGVSEGQLPLVKANEFRDIRAACARVRCSPKLTCIIAIKRHNTRFFPTTVNQRNNFNNMEPGTVEGRDIVRPNEV